MINWFLNLFRKNKRFTFYPNVACSGTGPAVTEFVRYQDEFRKATGKNVVMVKTYSSFGFERIVYEIRDNKR